MKKCPYCAEEIQDEAIKCRYCGSDLTTPPPIVGAPASAATEPSATGTAGITPAPVPGADEGGSSATRVSAAGGDGPSAAPAGVSSAEAQTTQIPVAGPTEAIAFSHTGYRYLLGHGADFFGIWDRQAPGSPISRFPRTDAGWRDAWQQYASLEPHGQPVGEPGAPGGAPTYAEAPRTNGMAVASLVLGILWFWWIGSILALIFGYVGKGEIERSNGRQTGRGLAIAGIVLGWIGVAAGIIAIIIVAAVHSSNGFH